MLELINITLSRNGRKILDKINLKIYSQEIHSILGVNGTGKTTLAYAIMGLPEYKINSGKIIFKDKLITRHSMSERARLGITLAWQEPARFEGLSVQKYLEISKGDKNSTLDPIRALEKVGLDPEKYLERELDNTLSGGERKRIELAAVLIMQPRLAILDEPDSGIDTLSIDYIKQVIRMLASQGSSVMLITHHEEIVSIADRASTLCRGRILKTGLPEEAIRFYRNNCRECKHINQPEEEIIKNV